MPTSASHWHLVLNHFPVVGTMIALGLLAAGLYLGSRDLKRASLVLFLILSLMAIVAFVSGSAAAVALEEAPTVSPAAVVAHEDAAILGLSVLFLVGWLAWFVLWQDRRRPSLDGWGPWAVLVTGAVSVLFMLWTARLGGDVNHLEVRGGPPIDADGTGLQIAIENWVYGGAWTWPAMETVHFVGMALLFGVVLVTAVRILGFVRVVPYAAFHRLLPLGVFGFVLNVITGMIFFVTNSGRYTAMVYGFYPKMVLIVVGGVAAVYFTIFDRPWELKPGDEAPTSAKAVAVGTVLAWILVMVFGRILPYVEGL